MSASPGTSSSRCRIPYVNPSETVPAVADALNVMPMKRHIFLLLAHSPGLFPPLMQAFSALFSSTTRTLPLLDWQLVVLRVATTLGSEYEWDVNSPVAKVHGMPERKMQAIQAKTGVKSNDDSGDGAELDDTIFSKRDRIILKLVDEQLATYSNQASTMDEAQKLLTSAELVEIFMIISLYVMIARLTNAVGIDLDGEIPGLEKMIKDFVT